MSSFVYPSSGSTYGSECPRYNGLPAFGPGGGLSSHLAAYGQPSQLRYGTCGAVTLGPDVPRTGSQLMPGDIVIVAVQNAGAVPVASGQDLAALLVTVPISSGTTIGFRWFPHTQVYSTTTGAQDVRFVPTVDIAAGTVLLLRSSDGVGNLDLVPVVPTAGFPVAGTQIAHGTAPIGAPNNNDSAVVYTLGWGGLVPLYMVAWGPETGTSDPVLTPFTDRAHYTVLTVGAFDGLPRGAYIHRITRVLEDTLNGGAGLDHIAYIPETWRMAGAAIATRTEDWSTVAPWVDITGEGNAKTVLRVAASPGQLAAIAMSPGNGTGLISAQFRVVVTSALPPETVLTFNGEPYVEGTGLTVSASPAGARLQWISPSRTLLAGTVIDFIVPVDGTPLPATQVTVYDTSGSTDNGTVTGKIFGLLGSTSSWIALVTDERDPPLVSNPIEGTGAFVVNYVAALRSTEYAGGLPPEMVPGFTTSTEMWPPRSVLPKTGSGPVQYTVPQTTFELQREQPQLWSTQEPRTFKTVDEAGTGLNVAARGAGPINVSCSSASGCACSS